MPYHNNPSITDANNKILNTKAGDHLSNALNPVIQPTYEVFKPCINWIKLNQATNSASQTLATAPSDKDTYILGSVISLIKDATATSTLSNINVIIDGVLTPINTIVSLTLTAQQFTNTVNLPIPIKIDRGSNITIANGTAVGNISTRCLVFGYTLEVTK